MTQVHSFVRLVVQNAVGVVHFNQALSSRAELLSRDDESKTQLIIEVCNLDGQVAARVDGIVDGVRLNRQSAFGNNFEQLVEDTIALIPEALTDMPYLSVKLTGEPVEGGTLNPAIGNSTEGTINQVTSAAHSASSGDVASFLNMVVTEAVEFVAQDFGNDARLKIETANSHMPTWVNISRFVSDKRGELFCAQTNDMCLMVGIPPTLNLFETDPGVVHEKAVEYLLGKFADRTDVSVQLFLEPRHRSHSTILQGTAAGGTLAPKAEFPSL
jgi:hypothetical protein